MLLTFLIYIYIYILIFKLIAYSISSMNVQICIKVGFCPSGVLSQWGFVLVGFCPVGFCPSGVLSQWGFVLHSERKA